MYVKRVPERGSCRREEDIGEAWPELPEWATPDVLDLEVRRDLRGLSKEGADWVAAHLVAATALADDDPETAWHHARAARARGGRIGVVRETVGLVAYRAGEWAEAIGELRAARRMGGGPGQLAVIADCERALGHPERAIELSRSAEADDLDPDAAAELSIVVSGARADLGQIDAALAHLERVGLDKAEQHPRLAYAYADLLLQAGRPQEALSWFIRSANSDTDEETDALDRVAALSSAESGATAGGLTAQESAESAESASSESGPDQTRPSGAASFDSVSGERVLQETTLPAPAADPVQSAEAAVPDEDFAATIEVAEPEPDDDGSRAAEPGDGAVGSTKESTPVAVADADFGGDADGDSADNASADDDLAENTGTADGKIDRRADDDFGDDDDLEFKPASAPPSTTEWPGTSTVDHTDVPSLLFSDDPQVGDR